MSSTNTAASSASAASPSAATSSLPSGSGRPMTWAERLAGKASSSASPSTSQTSNNRMSNGRRPASSSVVSTSSSSQADSANAPGDSSNPSSSRSTAQRNSRTASNGSTHNDSATAATSTSVSSPTAGNSRIPTSADSGWGEAETSIDSNKSRLRIQSATQTPSAKSSSVVNESVADDNSAETSKTSEADASSASIDQTRAPPGPPKVNIWQVRKEEAAKKAAEQAKLTREQEELQKQQQPTEASASKAISSNKEKNDNTSSDPVSTGTKSGKKKRENQPPASTSTPTANAGNTPNKGKESNKKAGANKQTTKGASNTPKQPSQSSNTGKTAVAGTETPAAAVTSANQSDWPSPGEEKEREDAEGQKKTQNPIKGREDGVVLSNQGNTEAGTTSPSRSKKHTWKTIQPDITFNSPLPSRKSSDGGKPAKIGSKPPKQSSSGTSGTNAASSKDLSRSSSKQTNKDTISSDKQASVAPSPKEAVTLPLPSNNGQSEVESSAPVMASAPIDMPVMSQTSNRNSATSPSLQPRAASAKHSNTVPSPLPSSLPAKPIGAPTGDIPRSRLSPSMHGLSPSTSGAPLRSRQSPAVPSNSVTPELGDMQSPPVGRIPQHSNAFDVTRSPPVGQAMLPPPPSQFGMMPSAPGQMPFHPSIAPMPHYTGQPGRGKRGGLNGNAGRGGGRAGNGGNGRVSNFNPNRNQSPNAYGQGTTSPIMGHQNLYQQGQGYPGALPPHFYFDPSQAQPQFNPQFDGSVSGSFNNGMLAYYPPFMYPPPPLPHGNAEGLYFHPGGSPAQQPATLPSHGQQNRQTQQGFPPPPRSAAPSEASQISQPESSMPVPQQGMMHGGAPVFQPMPSGYPTPSGLNGAIPSNMPFNSPPPQMNAIPPFSPPQLPHQALGGQPQHQNRATQTPQSQLQQGGIAPQHTMGIMQQPPTYARPSPLYDYSFIMFPPDGIAFWVLGQIEFYFSADNLVRDTFLRQSMDEEGWVDIALIATFKRLNSLTQDINLIRSMMETSFICEVREMKVRNKEWKSWILPGARKVHWQYPEESSASSNTSQQQQFGQQFQQGLATQIPQQGYEQMPHQQAPISQSQQSTQ